MARKQLHPVGLGSQFSRKSIRGAQQQPTITGMLCYGMTLFEHARDYGGGCLT
jgi:hypothetical protein